jgi:hypothetical protein
MTQTPGVFQDEEHRTNIGILNTSSEQIQVRVSLSASEGGFLGDAIWTLGPYEWKQAPATTLGVDEISNGLVRFVEIGSGALFQTYISVVDQETGDAIYVPGQ